MRNFCYYFVYVFSLFIAMKSLATALILLFTCLWVLFFGETLFAAWDITDSSFEINVGDFTPGGTSFIGDNSEETIDNVLVNILEKLLIVFGALAVLIMTIGAWYMIMAHGQDEFITRWKSIFISWVIALVIALSSGVLVQLFAYILYS